jgi:site-specific DNA-cytosine methylase
VGDKLKVLSLCDGISGGKMAFDRLGIEVEYHAVEIDRYARLISAQNFPDILRWENDVTKITKEQIEKHGPFDWVIFGFPCVAYSVAGSQGGIDQDDLLLHCMKILNWAKELNPNVKFLAENVKMKEDLLKVVNNIIGVEPVLICSSLLSAQRRQRNYWTNFPVVSPDELNIIVSDILEEVHDFPEKIDFKAGDIEFFEQHPIFSPFNYSSSGRGGGVVEGRFSYAEKACTLTATGYSQRAITAVTNGINEKYRNLTVREWARLQTIDNDFDFSVVDEEKAKKAIGNGWTVDVVAHIIKCAFDFEEEKDLL